MGKISLRLGPFAEPPLASPKGEGGASAGGVGDGEIYEVLGSNATSGVVEMGT